MTTTAQPPAAPATMPLLDLVKSLGAELYLDGVRYCPNCRQPWGSERCTCGQDPALTTATAVSGRYAGRSAYRPTICERCGTFAPPDATECLVCTGRCGCRCCGGTR